MGFTQEEIDSLLSGAGSPPAGLAASPATATMDSPPTRAVPALQMVHSAPANRSNTDRSAGISSLGASSDVTRIVHLPVPVKVELASRSMPLSAILQLTEGSIIDFQKNVDDELLLVVANRCIGSGRAVKVGENFGLRITRIGSVKKRIEAMGG